MVFTQKFIESLKPTGKINDIREGKGFGIRVLPSGVRTWFFLYRYEGNRRFMNLGHYPGVSLAEARARYRAAYGLYEKGLDPARMAEKEKEERRAAPTVSDLCKEYIERHAKKFKRSWQDDERLLNKEIIPLWGKRKAEDVTKRDVTLLLESIVDRGTPAMSNQVLKITRKMFNFALERDILQHTPFTGVKALAPNNRRERVLSEEEIRSLWLNIGNAAMSEEITRILQLVLITGQRPGEVSGMQTKEINGNWWTIPAERSKNGREHRVFLTEMALELIGDTGENGYVFPCPHIEKKQSIDAHALPSAVRRNLAWPLKDKKGKLLYDVDGKLVTENRLGVEQFTPHDLRRTAATFMASMGYMDEIIDAVLNHVKQGIIRTYNRHDYDKEKQQALEAWERKLKMIISGQADGKIVSILKRKSAA
jgi:integrase